MSLLNLEESKKLKKQFDRLGREGITKRDGKKTGMNYFVLISLFATTGEQ